MLYVGDVICDVEVRDAGPKGRGVFARRPFAPGEFIFRRRHVRILSAAQVDTVSEWEQTHLCSLGSDRFAILAAPGCYLNHSCEPSAVRHGVKVIAWSPIETGEEITLDYRLNALGGGSWPCECGSMSCTGTVVGDFFALAPTRQELFLSHTPGHVRREHRRRQTG